MVLMVTHSEALMQRKQRPSGDISTVLASLRQVSRDFMSVREQRYGSFEFNGDSYDLPVFVFSGSSPRSSDSIRLGIFATIHGDEPEGAYSLASFFAELAQNPELAIGYEIRAYPLVNPTGFEDGTRHSRRGKDLNREFWLSSVEPEVISIEDELWRHHFDGLIALHSDDTSEGLYGFVQGPDLSKELLLPALAAAEQFLPRNEQRIIDGFPANRGLIQQGYKGVLAAPPQARHVPFDLVLETPQNAPVDLQVRANVAALKSILAEYRNLQSYAPNI